MVCNTGARTCVWRNYLKQVSKKANFSKSVLASSWLVDTHKLLIISCETLLIVVTIVKSLG